MCRKYNLQSMLKLLLRRSNNFIDKFLRTNQEHCVKCMHNTVHVRHSACRTQCMCGTVHAQHSAYTAQCMQNTVHAQHSACAAQSVPHSPLVEIKPTPLQFRSSALTTKLRKILLVEAKKLHVL